MPYAVYIFRTNGEVEQSTQPKAPTGDQIRAAIGGWMETVPYFTAYCAHRRGTCYADEEGILKRKPINIKATELWHQNLERYKVPYRHSQLHGDVIFYAKIKEEA